jgi:nicotinamidase-related amidase
MLDIENCCLAVVDVQGKLAQLMHDKEALFKNIRTLIRTAQILEIPILWCQQVPGALGPTVPEIAELLNGIEPVNKSAFSCCRADQFRDKLRTMRRNQVLLCGIESHVCVYQTAVDLLAKGLTVNVVADAISSRTPENKRVGIDRMAASGAAITCVEMALFELLRTAEHPKFRHIARLIK